MGVWAKFSWPLQSSKNNLGQITGRRLGPARPSAPATGGADPRPTAQDRRHTYAPEAAETFPSSAQRRPTNNVQADIGCTLEARTRRLLRCFALLDNGAPREGDATDSPTLRPSKSVGQLAADDGRPGCREIGELKIGGEGSTCICFISSMMPPTMFSPIFICHSQQITCGFRR